jgi:spore coat protein CotH
MSITMLEGNQLTEKIKMIEINRISSDNIKKTWNVTSLGNYLVVKFNDENNYVIFKGTDKNYLTKKKFNTLDDALQYLHDRAVDHSVYSDLCKDRFGTRGACTSDDFQIFQYGTDKQIKTLFNQIK